MILNASTQDFRPPFGNMPPQGSHSAAVLAIARAGPIRARDLAPLGVPRTYLSRLVTQGRLVALGGGLYQAAGVRETELHTLVAVMKHAPKATACLLTALQLHGLTTELPHAVWVMIPTHARPPTPRSTKLEVVRASGPALTFGIEEQVAEGLRFQVTSPAKTVADCFRYRRRVGFDVALAALRDYLARRRARGGVRFSVDALTEAAAADRIYTVMEPYLEALT